MQLEETERQRGGRRCQSWGGTIALGILALTLLVAVNHAVGQEMALPVFWLLPVLLVAVRCGTRAGALMAALAGACMVAESLYFGVREHRHVDYLGLGAEIAAFAAVAGLVFSLQKALQQLRETQALRDDLTHVLVHDLKHPLVSAEMALNLLRRDPGGPEAEERLELARGSLRVLQEMIGEILTIAAAEAGKLGLAREPVDLAALVQEAVQQARGRAEERRITVAVSGDGAVPIEGDVFRLRRVLWNLLDNSLKFTPPEGQVAISVHRKDGEAEVEVADSGPGIPRELQPLLFRKFAQPEAERQGQQLSVGLGLYYCRLIVEAHGGRIWLESPGEGGSVFHFTLPLAASPSREPGGPREPRRHDPQQ